jgi:hypothetical protein
VTGPGGLRREGGVEIEVTVNACWSERNITGQRPPRRPAAGRTAASGLFCASVGRRGGWKPRVRSSRQWLP